MNIRSVAVSVGALALAVAVGLAGEAGVESGPTPHPHFNDGGTLSWSTKLANAQIAAKASGKLILIEYGRED